MFHDDEFNRIFKQMSGSFVNLDDVFEMLKNAGKRFRSSFLWLYHDH